MSLTKTNLIERLRKNHGLTRKTSRAITESLLETIKTTLISGEDVLISGFGKFRVIRKNQRRVRNPATGNALILGPRRTVTFKCSGLIKNKLNGV